MNERQGLRVKARLSRDFMLEGFRIFVSQRISDAGYVVLDDSFEGLRISAYADGEVPPNGVFVSTESAQGLLNDLYNAGLRPTEERFRDGEAKAKEAHIADLQNIVKQVLPAALRRG
jgi:hypothetical protein